MLGRRDKAKGLEAEVQSLEVRRSGVLNRLTDATARHEGTVAEQRRFLVDTDGADARQAKALAEACRKAADDRAALEDAARTLAGLIEDAKARLAAERDRRERDRAAGEIEAGAAEIEAAAIELDRVATVFDVARERLVQACRAHAPRDIVGQGPEYGIVSAAARRAGITSREPDVTARFGTFFLDAVPAAAPTVAAMRANAKAVREGAAPNTRPAKRPEPMPPPLVFSEIVVILAGPAVYRGHLNHRVELPAGGVSIPEPIAARAIELGVGFPQLSREGQDILRILRSMPAARLERTDTGFRGVAFTGALGDDGQPGPGRRPVGLPPAQPPADLGSLPTMFGVVLPQAAQ